MTHRMHSFAFACALFALTACGARTGLSVPDGSIQLPDGSMGITDITDVSDVSDVTDVTDVSDVHDAPFVPPPEVCVDGGIPYIYVVTEQYSLYSYFPPSNAFTRIGRIECPTSTSTPFSMAVDRGGTAYVVYNDGQLFRVSTATAQCESTPFVQRQHGITTFGMGFVSDTTDSGETLYIASTNFGGGTSYLGTINVHTYDLAIVHALPPTLITAELTGTGDGRLYGFSATTTGPTGSNVAQINRTTAAVVASWDLPSVTQGQGWAFASWGGAFYIFTAPTGTSTVTRFRPQDGSVAVILTLPETIVGAGVSTCAPHQ